IERLADFRIAGVEIHANRLHCRSVEIDGLAIYAETNLPARHFGGRHCVIAIGAEDVHHAFRIELRGPIEYKPLLGAEQPIYQEPALRVIRDFSAGEW